MQRRLILIFLFVFSSDANRNMTIVQQRNILALLYHSTGGDRYWNIGWPVSDLSEENNPCTWFGIECREADKQSVGDSATSDKDFFITGINLKKNNLIGFVPSEIFLLPDLRRIILSSNKIRAIGLDSSCIRNNSDTVNMQPDIKKDMHQEYMSMFEVDLNMISEVQNRVIENNDLELPSTTIVEIDLSKNNLTCYNPQSLWQYLPNLEKLDFSINDLGGTLPDFQMFQNLHTINFASTGLVGSLPSSLLNTSRSTHTEDALFTIDLISNEISGSIPLEFKDFFRLNLYLQNNKIQDIPPQVCKQLEWMNGEVGIFGCQAILCPPKTFSSVGRQTSIDSRCEKCQNEEGLSDFFGQLTCSDSLQSEDIETEETIATWSRLANARFWGYFSLFVFAFAGVFTFVGD